MPREKVPVKNIRLSLNHDESAVDFRGMQLPYFHPIRNLYEYYVAPGAVRRRYALRRMLLAVNVDLDKWTGWTNGDGGGGALNTHASGGGVGSVVGRYAPRRVGGGVTTAEPGVMVASSSSENEKGGEGNDIDDDDDDDDDRGQSSWKASSVWIRCCLLYTSPSPRDATLSRMPSSA